MHTDFCTMWIGWSLGRGYIAEVMYTETIGLSSDTGNSFKIVKHHQSVIIIMMGKDCIIQR